MAQVKFAKGLKSNFDKLTTKDSNIVYFLTDSQEIYVGETCVGNVFTQEDISEIEAVIGEATSNISDLQTRTTTLESNYPISITETAGTGNIATIYTIKQNNKTWTINTIKDKVVSSGRYDIATKSIILILNDNNTISIPVADLIDTYTGSNNSEINVSIVNNTISASLNDNSIGKSKLNSSIQTLLDKATSSDIQLDWEEF